MTGNSSPPKPRAPVARTVACPNCGAKAAFEPWNPWRPFCSERCRVTDLGAWANEGYRIPAKPEDDENAEPPEDNGY